MYRKKNPSTVYHVKEPAQLLEFLMIAMNGVSRNKAKLILSGSGVKVNGKPQTRHDYALHTGDAVEVSAHKPKATLTNKFLKMEYEDKDIVVIEKNVGILSMSPKPNIMSVKTVLDNYFRKNRKSYTAHVVHRLDRDTSGLLVYAKTMQAEQILENNWSEIVTDRRYIALVSGRMEQSEGTVKSWLKDNKNYITCSSPTDNGGKLAITHFRVLRSNDHYSLVELKLETGRKNQIRVHMQDLGHPVCGDIKYGNGDDPIGRLALHAFRLNFYHPILGDHMSFETPVPKIFLTVFKGGE